MTSKRAAARHPATRLTGRGASAWLRIVLLALLVVAPGIARAAMVGCPTMALPGPAVAPEQPCHAMTEDGAAADEVPTAPDDASTECCGSACAPALAVFAQRIETRVIALTAEPGMVPGTALASIRCLPEKPPPRT